MITHFRGKPISQVIQERDDLLRALRNLVEDLCLDIPQAKDTLRVQEARAAIAKAEGK
jgi:hypothetical protein